MPDTIRHFLNSQYLRLQAIVGLYMINLTMTLLASSVAFRTASF